MKVFFTLIIIFLSSLIFISCATKKQCITEKIIQEEVLKTKNSLPSTKPIDQLDKTIENIKNKDIPEINKKSNDK